MKKHPEKIKSYQKKWRDAHKEEQKIKSYEKSREKLLEQRKIIIEIEGKTTMKRSKDNIYGVETTEHFFCLAKIIKIEKKLR
jgi:hypothetical protein